MNLVPNSTAIATRAGQRPVPGLLRVPTLSAPSCCTSKKKSLGVATAASSSVATPSVVDAALSTAENAALALPSVITNQIFQMGVIWLCKGCVAVVAAMALARALRQWGSDLRLEELEEVGSMDSSDDEFMEMTQSPQLWRVVLASAAYRPAVVILPFLVASFIWRQGLQTIDAAYSYAAAHKRDLPAWVQPWMKGVTHQADVFDGLVEPVFSVVSVLVAVWLVIRIKDKLVEFCIAYERRKRQSRADALQRLAIPLSSLLSWVLTAAAGMYCLQIAGIDLKPLLAIGGVSGIVVGLSAQNVLANLIAGLNIFITRPFVRGERISLYSAGGSHVLSGVVDNVNPLRTTIIDNDSLPYGLPNKVLLDLSISNESRIGRQMVESTIGLRHLKLQVSCALKDTRLSLEDVCRQLEADLTRVQGYSPEFGCLVDVAGFKDDAFTLRVALASVSAVTRTRKGNVAFRLRVVAAVLDTLRRLDCQKVSATIVS